MSEDRKYLRPGWLTRLTNRVVGALGFVPTLAVRGRTSGEWRTVAVNVLEHENARYLVAPRGETEWVRNLRAAGGGELRQRGSVEPFRAIEVADPEKGPLIAAYREKWDSQVRRQFAALPRDDDHPVFLIQPTDELAQ